MEDKLTKAPGSDAPAPAATPAAPNLEETRSAAAAAERARIAELRKIARAVRLDETFVEPFIEKGASIEDFRKAVLEKLAAASDALPETRSAGVEVTRDGADGRRLAMSNSLLHRFNPSQHKLDEQAREYRAMSLLRLAEECCVAAGKRVRGMSPLEMAGFALHSTSDFPNILAATANKTLRAGYEMAPQTWRPLALRDSIADFKLKTLLQLGDVSDFKKTTEAGEFKRGTLAEGKETYRLFTYGEIIGITRQVIINDDLGAFTRVPMLLGRAAADLESATVWKVITDNAALVNDNVALFHATHTNLTTGPGTVIAIASLDVMRARQRKQKGPGGRFMNLSPRFLVVPAELETVAFQFTNPGAVVPNAQANVNPFAGTLTPIAEPILSATSATAWYLFADPNVPGAEVLVYAYLSGQEGIFTETRNGFDVDGVEIKARLDFGAAAIDFRGAQKNDGA